MKSIHDDIHDFLKDRGLTPTEITLYVTGLQFGRHTASELARRVGIKRTTVYSALTSLEQKGMMGVHTQSGTTYYTATEPSLIERKLIEEIDILKHQRLEFINLLPLFDDLQFQSATKTEVASYYGVSGVKTVVDAALYCASRSWKIIAPKHNFFSDYDVDYGDYFIRVRKQRGIRAKSLWEPSFIRNRTFDDTAFEFRNPRILPKQLEGKFKSTIIIFDNSVAFINSAEESSAVLIKSVEIRETMEVFFDGLWGSAQPVPKRNRK